MERMAKRLRFRRTSLPQMNTNGHDQTFPCDRSYLIGVDRRLILFWRSSCGAENEHTTASVSVYALDSLMHLLRRVDHRWQPEQSLLRLPLERCRFYCFAAAFFAAQRFFKAATMLALPSALSRRFAFLAGLAGAEELPLVSAHLFLCAAAIAFRPAALILRRGVGATSGDASFASVRMA